jgi:hypothetical protein
MNRLINIGFTPIGHWSLYNNRIQCKLNTHQKTSNILYAFICNSEIKYIGKTTVGLAKRMYGYQNPSPTQSTNIRVNNLIKEVLLRDSPVDILILVDNGLLKYGDFKINLAAGLEGSLIFDISPDWNYSGKNEIVEDVASMEIELPKASEDVILSGEIVEGFTILLGRAYYKSGFFNIKQKYSDLFGVDNDKISIQLGEKSEDIIEGYINRSANPNKAPRIMGGISLTNWIKDNFEEGDNMKISVLSPNSIQLYR